MCKLLKENDINTFKVLIMSRVTRLCSITCNILHNLTSTTYNTLILLLKKISRLLIIIFFTISKNFW